MDPTSNAKQHEETFIQSFIAKDHRDRLSFELEKRREDFLGRFCHRALIYLDTRFVIALPKPNSDPRQILRLLKDKGAPAHCYVISMKDEIDGQFLPLADALSGSMGFGYPSILSCIAGKLVYLETEQEVGPPDRFILFRA